MLTVFANIRINDPERLQHMKDSFYSFRSISDNWVINVRGSQRQQAVDFLKKELGNQITLFELLDDKRGWIQNTLKMLPSVKYDYMLVWNEDHICLAEPDEIKGVVNEMKDHNVVYLPYTWWFFGKIKKGLEALPFNHARFIDHVTLSSDDWKKATDKGYPYGLIALCGIFKVTFFKQLMLLDKYKLPLFLTTNFYRFATVLNKIGISFNQRKAFNTVNKLLFHKLRRYSKETPFDLEKDRSRTEILPLKVAWPKKGDFVLDIAAAPGSKTTHLAALMKNTGLIIANDPDYKRIKALNMNIQRSGITNTIITKMPGRFFKNLNFDKILLDYHYQ